MKISLLSILLLFFVSSSVHAGIESILKKKKKPRVQNKSEVITVRGLNEGQLPGTGGNSEAVVVRISKDELRQFLKEGGLNTEAIQ